MKSIEIIRPDDWHLHVRDDEIMRFVVNISAKQMGRAIIMPNLSKPIIDTQKAHAYYKSIVNSLDKDVNFQPLMTLYLTDNTSVEQINVAIADNTIFAAKLYPAGATTNSANGVSNISNIYHVLEAMQKAQMPLLIHGEVNNNAVDIFDREAVFIDTVLLKLVKDFPELKIVFEHITTKNAVDFVMASNANIGATITAHHLIANRNDMLTPKINPHYFCLPILKRKDPHQLALIAAATSGNAKFFLGSDSAPHTIENKESACGCAGIFSAHCAIELYTMVFDTHNALDKLEGFASKFGADFYNLPYNKDTIILEKNTWKVPSIYEFGEHKIVPFMAGESLDWQITN